VQAAALETPAVGPTEALYKKNVWAVERLKGLLIKALCIVPSGCQLSGMRSKS
jgi:hypothetical protein